METVWPPFPRDLPFGAHYIYPRPAEGNEAVALKNFILGIKQDRYTRGAPPKRLIEAAVEAIRQRIETLPYGAWFDGKVVLVPVPGSGLTLPHSVIAAKLICEEMDRQDFGQVFTCLKRVTAVQKSAYAGPGERPDHQLHFDTLRVEKRLTPEPSDIILVDDVVTRGATFLGAAARLAEAYPGARIRAFGIARTAPFAGRNSHPCIGTISVRNGLPVARIN